MTSLARPFIGMRNDHQDALAAGLAVSEFSPFGKSADEIRDLWQWVEQRLNGGVAANEEISRARFRTSSFRSSSRRSTSG